jgi:hypothetical protein
VDEGTVAMTPELLDILRMQNSLRLARELVKAIREHYDVDDGKGNVPADIMDLVDALDATLPL